MIKLLIVFIAAAAAPVGSGYADEQTQISGLTYQCPYPLTTLGELPAGWKVKEHKGSAVMHLLRARTRYGSALDLYPRTRLRRDKTQKRSPSIHTPVDTAGRNGAAPGKQR